MFPAFEKELQREIQEQGEIRFYKTDEQLMRTGQYFRSTMLILSGLVKIYREGDDGNEFFMYYLQPGQACALSMVCAAEHMKSADPYGRGGEGYRNYFHSIGVYGRMDGKIQKLESFL